jgi:hypothetical protein
LYLNRLPFALRGAASLALPPYCAFLADKGPSAATARALVAGLLKFLDQVKLDGQGGCASPHRDGPERRARPVAAIRTAKLECALTTRVRGVPMRRSEAADG